MKNNDPSIPSDTERRFRERMEELTRSGFSLDVAKAQAEAEARKDRLAQLERAFAVLERLARAGDNPELRFSDGPTREFILVWDTQPKVETDACGPDLISAILAAEDE